MADHLGETHSPLRVLAIVLPPSITVPDMPLSSPVGKIDDKTNVLASDRRYGGLL